MFLSFWVENSAIIPRKWHQITTQPAETILALNYFQLRAVQPESDTALFSGSSRKNLSARFAWRGDFE